MSITRTPRALWQYQPMIVTRSRADFATRAAIVLITLLPNSAANAATRVPKMDSVEIQIGLCAEPESIGSALDLRSRGAPLQVWLFDDAGLVMFERGLRFRLRVSDDRSELTLKVADQNCAELAHGSIPTGEGKCEYDAHGDTLSGAVSLSRRLGAKQTRELLSGRAPLTDMLSDAQIAYLRQGLDAWPLPADVRPLGPIEVQRYRVHRKPYDVDVSRLPDGARYVEISRKGPVQEAAQLRAELEADLAVAGVATCADQSARAQQKLRSLLITPLP